MLMVYHGGRCCGIKHIHSLTSKPENTLIAMAEYTGTPGAGMSPRMYKNARPAETAFQRLTAYVEYAKKAWPDHIVEVVTAKAPYSDQTANWADALIRLGFKVVNQNKNSNSNNVITVWHLNINDGKAPEIEETEEE